MPSPSRAMTILPLESQLNASTARMRRGGLEDDGGDKKRARAPLVEERKLPAPTRGPGASDARPRETDLRPCTQQSRNIP
eukprot:1244433-Pyramimonas_sp.AAC.1